MTICFGAAILFGGPVGRLFFATGFGAWSGATVSSY